MSSLSKVAAHFCMEKYIGHQKTWGKSPMFGGRTLCSCGVVGEKHNGKIGRLPNLHTLCEHINCRQRFESWKGQAHEHINRNDHPVCSSPRSPCCDSVHSWGVVIAAGISFAFSTKRQHPR